jgi:hypothetical protein
LTLYGLDNTLTAKWIPGESTGEKGPAGESLWNVQPVPVIHYRQQNLFQACLIELFVQGIAGSFVVHNVIKGFTNAIFFTEDRQAVN